MRAPALLAVILLACAPRLGGESERVEEVAAGGARFVLRYQPEDAAAAAQVEAALGPAAARAGRWAALRTPVVVTVHPSHAALEEAVHRERYPWLRAWARFASIDLQSPRTWSFLGASDGEVEEIVTHELTHCAMYQAAGTEWNWPYREIPLWFREGMASVTARQGYRRASPEEVRRYYREAGGGDGYPGRGGPAPPGGGDPVSNPEPLYQDESEVVYGAAHWAFQFLLDRYGEERIRGILSGMGRGLLFPEAFRDAVGIPEAAFERDFRRYVVWRGWR